jgi:acyl CoA:acetate/3-ketoacid CoA transferase beta subunit
MYVNGKMIPVETLPGMGGAMRESDGGGKFKYDIFNAL